MIEGTYPYTQCLVPKYYNREGKVVVRALVQHMVKYSNNMKIIIASTIHRWMTASGVLSEQNYICVYHY